MREIRIYETGKNGLYNVYVTDGKVKFTTTIDKEKFEALSQFIADFLDGRLTLLLK